MRSVLSVPFLGGTGEPLPLLLPLLLPSLAAEPPVRELCWPFCSEPEPGDASSRLRI